MNQRGIPAPAVTVAEAVQHLGSSGERRDAAPVARVLQAPRAEVWALSNDACDLERFTGC